MTKNTVTVVPDDNGNVIRQSENNAEYGYVRVIQDALIISKRGFVNRKSRSALIIGKLEDLKELGLGKQKKLPGKIVVIESTEPFDAENPDRDLKIAGSTGIICCTGDGEPIYRTTYYDATGLDEDTLIPHANGDAIREANASSAGAEAIAKDEFDGESEEATVEEATAELDDDDIEEDSFEL
jgi:hypothetical protein